MIFWFQNHQGEKCPDHWRQFHRTTDENFQEPDNRKSSKKPSCYNCSGDHWVSFISYKALTPYMISGLTSGWNFSGILDPESRSRGFGIAILFGEIEKSRKSRNQPLFLGFLRDFLKKPRIFRKSLGFGIFYLRDQDFLHGMGYPEKKPTLIYCALS